MLDLKFIREHQEEVKWAIKVKNVKLNLDDLLAADQQVRKLKAELQELQTQKNVIAKQIPAASAEEKEKLILQGRHVGEQIKKLEPLTLEAEQKLQEYLWLVPNIPLESVPEGMNEAGNIEVSRHGDLPKFDFTPLGHTEILEKHHWAEFERIAKISGSRSYALRGDMVLLEVALHRLALDKLKQRGFTLFSAPAFVREQVLYGTGHFPTGRDQVYYLPEEDLYLSGTSELQINSLYNNEILKEAELPLLFAGLSTCFRREAGSYGKDVRGLIRVHQFTKVEQFVFCKADAVESAHWHERLLSLSEEILQDLELPYRIIECCTGDMGAGKVKMFDLEAWVPSENRYMETHSCSALYDWQARRTNTKYKDAAGNNVFCYTLNNTAIATPRIIVPILENHQQKDGSIKVPQALQPYLGGVEYLGK
jgi:seryl-tRNA synthetase